MLPFLRRFTVLCGCAAALVLVGCEAELPSAGPTRNEVIEQAGKPGDIVFDVVKIDDPVLAVLEAQRQPPFHQRFKPYVPPPELKIAIGDTLSITIWEAAEEGLFGRSLTPEQPLPHGAEAAPLPGTLQQPPPPSLAVPPPPPLTTPVQVPFQPPGAAPLAGGAARNGALAQAAGAGALAQAQAGETPGNQLGTRIPDQQVGSDGAISIPYAGRIPAAGRSAAELQRTIERRLASKAIKPQALVVVRRSDVNSVTISGEVVKGARVMLDPGGDRLLQVIAAAGGLSETELKQPEGIINTEGGPGATFERQIEAIAAQKTDPQRPAVHDTFVRLTRGDVTATVPLATLVAHPEENIFVEPGDVITLAYRPQTFAVFGATGKNAAFPFTSERLSLAEALAQGGGLLDLSADPSGVFLFRNEPVGLVRALGQPIATRAHNGLSPVVYRLDLREARSNLLAKRFPVYDRDVIFVSDASSQAGHKFLTIMSTLTGPVYRAVITCQTAQC